MKCDALLSVLKKIIKHTRKKSVPWGWGEKHSHSSLGCLAFVNGRASRILFFFYIQANLERECSSYINAGQFLINIIKNYLSLSSQEYSWFCSSFWEKNRSHVGRGRDFSKVVQHVFVDMGRLWSLYSQAESRNFALKTHFCSSCSRTGITPPKRGSFLSLPMATLSQRTGKEHSRSLVQSHD